MESARGMSMQARLGLLRLVSPALPVGGFSYSRGLEGAVAAGWVHDERSAGDFVIDVLERSLCPLDGAVLCRLLQAFRDDERDAVLHWTRLLTAFRESRELLLEDQQMGLALRRLLSGLEPEGARPLPEGLPPSYTCMFALAATRWGVAPEDALSGFFYACCDSMVSAALRLLPLGQSAGQRVLERALPAIERCAKHSATLRDDDIGNLCPGLALASATHETQYSRLFRS